MQNDYGQTTRILYIRERMMLLLGYTLMVDNIGPTTLQYAMQ